MSAESHLIIEHRSGIGIITLNRPEALNALNLGMIRAIREVLATWKEDEQIRAIIFRGAGDRAFCAGGDVKKMYEAGVGIEDLGLKTTLARVYFAEEYRMNRELFHYPKPTIAFMDGITMGGGFGVAGACNIRIATEKTVFAMPEVGIGFFPDVGSLYHLTRAPQRAGWWLALTGSSIGAADMLPLGLATHFMHADQFAAALEQMIEVEDTSILDQMSEEPDAVPARLGPYLSDIDNLFNVSSLDALIDRLQQAKSAVTDQTLKLIMTRSPTSLKLTFAYLQRMQGADFDAVTAMDYRLAIRCLQAHDFYEGIRAALIDKDKTPRWVPDSIDAVSDSVIENYFASDLPDLDQI